MPERVAVVGSRSWRNPDRVRSFVAGVALKYPDAVLVSGGCQTGRPWRGVDWAAEVTAFELGLAVVSFRVELAFTFDRQPTPRLRLPRWMDDPDYDATVEEWGEVRQRREAYYRQVNDYQHELAALRTVYCVVVHAFALDIETGFPASRETLLPRRYRSYGQAAYARDVMVVEEATQVVAFHADNSRGTGHVCTLATDKRKPLFVYEPR